MVPSGMRRSAFVRLAAATAAAVAAAGGEVEEVEEVEQEEVEEEEAQGVKVEQRPAAAEAGGGTKQSSSWRK